MQPFRSVSVFAVLSAFAVLISGCSRGGSSSAPASSVPSSGSSVSGTSSLGSSSEAENPSSGQGKITSNPSNSQPGPVLTITTDNQEFDQKFKKNPLDKAYIAESDKAVSTDDMVKVSEKYASLWEKEIAHAYDRLEERAGKDSDGRFAKLKAEQKSWEDKRAGSLKKIADAAAAGGSMARVDEAGAVMDYYRDRAAQLYRALYDSDKDYSYAFQSK